MWRGFRGSATCSLIHTSGVPQFHTYSNSCARVRSHTRPSTAPPTDSSRTLSLGSLTRSCGSGWSCSSARRSGALELVRARQRRAGEISRYPQARDLGGARAGAGGRRSWQCPNAPQRSDEFRATHPRRFVQRRDGIALGDPYSFECKWRLQTLLVRKEGSSEERGAGHCFPSSATI